MVGLFEGDSRRFFCSSEHLGFTQSPVHERVGPLSLMVKQLGLETRQRWVVTKKWPLHLVVYLLWNVC